MERDDFEDRLAELYSLINQVEKEKSISFKLRREDILDTEIVEEIRGICCETIENRMEKLQYSAELSPSPSPAKS